MLPLVLLLIFLAASTKSPEISVELFQSAFFSVLLGTYFGRLFMRLAKPSGSFTCGHTAANPSYVTRPNITASALVSESCWNLSPFGPRLKGPVQSPRPEPSMPTGSCMTPSTEMYSITVILFVTIVSFRSCADYGRCPHAKQRERLKGDEDFLICRTVSRTRKRCF